MSDEVCPYCRAGVDLAGTEKLVCEGCGTPHHSDCYAENGGCTVFGCRCAPSEEPKVAVSVPELAGVQLTGSSRPVYLAPSPVAAATAANPVTPAAGSAAVNSAITYVPSPQARNKMTFTLLGVFLGALGAHNFYAGYTGKAVGQLCLTLLTLGYGSPMAWIWAVIEICTVNCDSKGVQFRS